MATQVPAQNRLHCALHPNSYIILASTGCLSTVSPDFQYKYEKQVTTNQNYFFKKAPILAEQVFVIILVQKMGRNS